MTNKTVRNAGVAIIVGTLALGAYFYLNQEDESEFLTPDEPSVTEVIPEGPKDTPVAPKPVEGTPGEQTPLPDPEVAETVSAPDPGIEHKKAQDLLISEFKQNIKLEMNIPTDMNFTSIDVEDDIGVLYGTNPNNQNQMAIIAARRTGSPQAIASFLNESKEAFPMLKDQGFKISGKIEKLKAPEGTGLSNVTLIPGQQKSGRTIWAAHMERSDGAGSYLILMQANPSYFDQNEEGLDAMLRSMKAKK